MILSNKHRYTLLRISYLLLTPFYSLLAIFLKKNNNIIITGSLNREFSDNARALFENLIQYNNYKERVFFVINDAEKREALNQQYPDCFISNTNLREALFILRARYWFCSAMELPLATFFQWRLRHVIHLGHGMLYKRVGLSEVGVSWYKRLYYYLIGSNLTYTIATSEFCKKDIVKSFGLSSNRVLVTPQPKTAQIANPVDLSNSILSDTNFTHILYAPTWRPYADVKLFRFTDLDLPKLSKFLKDNNTHIWLRLHPRFEQNISEEFLELSNIHLFSVQEYSEINHYLAYFDGLITDYSSLYFDYLTLERPVLFFDYDLDEYNKKVGVIDEYQTIKCSPTTQSQAMFLEQLMAIKAKTYDLTEVKRINKLVNYPIKNEDIGNYVVEKLFSALDH